MPERKFPAAQWRGDVLRACRTTDNSSSDLWSPVSLLGCPARHRVRLALPQRHRSSTPSIHTHALGIEHRRAPYMSIEICDGRSHFPSEGGCPPRTGGKSRYFPKRGAREMLFL